MSRRRGYSLVEVVVAIFILAGVVLASFSVFEMGARLSLKIENRMVAARLAQRIVEQLRSMYSGDIATVDFSRFSSPFDRYAYLYSVEPSGFPSLPGLERISVTVEGPVDASGSMSLQSTSVSFSMLLARQTYSP